MNIAASDEQNNSKKVFIQYRNYNHSRGFNLQP